MITVTDSQKLNPSRRRRSRLSEHRRNLAGKKLRKIDKSPHPVFCQTSAVAVKSATKLKGRLHSAKCRRENAGKGSSTLAKLVREDVSNSSTDRHYCTCLGNLGRHDKDRIISICVVSLKVTKVSTILTVTCHWCWHFTLKTLPKEKWLNRKALI